MLYQLIHKSQPKNDPKSHTADLVPAMDGFQYSCNFLIHTTFVSLFLVHAAENYNPGENDGILEKIWWVCSIVGESSCPSRYYLD